MTDNGRRQWIAVDLGSRNINFGLAAEQPRPISTSAIFENTSVNEIMTTPSIFTIRKGERCFGARVLHMREENIIFDAMNVHQNQNNNGNKWYADFHQNCYHLVGENVHIKQSEAIAAILSNLRMELMKSRKIKEDEELGAVLVIPSNAGQIFRKIVIQASSIAGFSDVCLLNQSNAVALAYWRKCIDDEQQQVHGVDHHKSQQKYLLGILSMGAKTTECSIFELQPYRSPKLIKNIGCCDFGGDDFTEALMNQYLKIYENGIHNELAAGNKIKSLTKKFWESCEEAKKALSDLNLDDTKFINPICDQGDDDDTLTVEKFARFCAQEFAKLEQLFNQCFAPFYGKLDSFLLAGGSSQLKQIRHLIAKYAGQQCQVLNASAYEPTMLAQKGAAVKAAQMSFVRANIPMPNYFAKLSMNEWLYRNIQISHNSGVQISVAFPNTQLPSDYEHLAACGHSVVNQILSREMAIIHIFEINFSSAYLGSIQLSENAIYLTTDENGIVLIKNCLQKWEMSSPLLLNDDEFAQAYTEVMKYEDGIKNALKEKEIREKQRIAEAERKRVEEKKRKEEERKRKEEEERKRKEEEDRQRKEAEQKKRREEAAERKRKAAEEKKKKDEEERAKKEAEEKKRKEEEEKRKRNEEANEGTRPFTFIWPFHFCRNVELQGSWDGWKRRIEMERNTNGNDGFFHKMNLKPGYYEFQFIVDNARTTSYLYRKRMNCFKTEDNYITIDDFKSLGDKGGSGNQSSTATSHQSDAGHSSQHEQQSTYAGKVKGTQKGQGNDGSSSSSMQGKNNEMTGNTGQSSSKQSNGKKEENEKKGGYSLRNFLPYPFK